MKGLHMFASAHPGRPFMIACHEWGTLVWGWSRMYVYTLIMSASAHASFKGMLVNNSSSENLNCKPNMSHTVLSTPKQFQRSKPANKWKIMSLEKKLKGARFFGYLYFLLVCIFCAPKLELNTFFCTKGRSRAWWFRGTPILGNFHVYIYIYIIYIYIVF